MSDTAFFRGVPTAPTVRNIMEAHGDIGPGDKVTHELLEGAIMHKRNTNRYRGCVVAWKKALESQTGLLVRAVPGVGYEVLDSHGRVAFAGSIHRTGIKRIRRGAYVAAQTDRTELNDAERGACDYLMLSAASLRLSQKTKAKQLNLPEVAKG